MDIKQLAKRPELVEITLDGEDIVKEYGDSITFWMKDFVDITTYFDFFRSQGENSGNELNVLMRKIILNKEGQPVLSDDEALPIDISVAALTKINECLGKSKTRSSIQSDGNQPK
jgi:hypothetical protein